MAEGFVVRRGAPLGGGVFANGGTETVIEQNGVFYRVHTYTDVGTDDFEVLRGGGVEYLVVAGGGAGLQGGGGGGYFSKFVAGETGNTTSDLFVTVGNATVVVGAGGAKVTGDTANQAAGDGAASSFASITSIGGKGAFNESVNDIREGGDGGSGGGASASSNNTPGNGGTNGGDGGAAQRGNGGLGQGTPTETAISGTLVRYSGGGGGGVFTGAQPGAGGAGGGGIGALGFDQAGDGVDGLGGGGGGSGSIFEAENAGNGGSGIVIIRYRITQAEFEAA